jgi:hypothetical protein
MVSFGGRRTSLLLVMAGLVPAIHVFVEHRQEKEDVDARA